MTNPSHPRLESLMGKVITAVTVGIQGEEI
jgi:hypothetical protein